VIESFERALPIGHVRRGHGDGVWQSLRVDDNVSLDPRDLLPRIVALLACVSVFFTLCASTIRKVLWASRPCFSRAAPT
jgi:hypothetical protein